MVRLQIERLPPDLKQSFPKHNKLRGAEAVIRVAGVARFVGAVAGKWGPFVDRSAWTVWDLEGNPSLVGGIDKVGDHVLQFIRAGKEIVVLYSSRRSGVIRSEPTVEIAGREYGLPANLHDITLFEFGPCTFRWRYTSGQPELHLSLASERDLLPFIGFGYDLWKGVYLRGGSS
jgi:hypothetical protein